MGLVQFRKHSGRNGARTIVSSREVIMSPFGLRAILAIPGEAKALVVFVHGSGSSRFSPRNRVVAQAFNEHGIATLLLDLLTEEEAKDSRNVFAIDLLAERLVAAALWIDKDPQLRALPLGLFGASTGAAAALVAATRLDGRVGAIVSRGGRPDLVSDSLASLPTPVLLIVGGQDADEVGLNERALPWLRGPKAIEVVPGAGHFFREPGALTTVTMRAAQWFEDHLMRSEARAKASPRLVEADARRGFAQAQAGSTGENEAATTEAR